MENFQDIYLPFRINSKNSYFNFIDYLKSIPSLVFVFLYLIINKKNSIIVFHGFPFQFLAPLISFFNSKKVYIVYHQFKKNPITLFGKFSIKIEKFFIQFSPKLFVVGVSPWVVNFLKQTFKPKNKIKTLSIPISIKESNNKFLIKSLENKKYLIYGARLVKEKGQIRLLRDLQKMNIRKPMIENILFCGSGSFKEEINLFAKNHLPNFNIIILDNLAHKNYLNLVKSSSGFLFPSYREAFPLSLIEAIFTCDRIFIWEKYLYDFYSECSYEKNDLKNFLIKGELRELSKRHERINKLKKDYLNSEIFTNLIF